MSGRRDLERRASSLHRYSSKLLEVSIRLSSSFFDAFVFFSILNIKSNFTFVDMGVTISKLHFVLSGLVEMDS